MTDLAIGYFADGPWSHNALDKLLHDSTIDVAFICARFDSPDPKLRKIAAIHGIPFIRHAQVNDDIFFKEIKKYECDLFVSMSFNQIFKSRLITLPRLKTINCHAGKLPFYRGRNVLNWALINDEKEFGITVHYIDAGIDTGDILKQITVPITDEDTYATLLEKAYLGCADTLYATIKDMQVGNVEARSQSEIHPLGSYCSARGVGDERLNWSQSSRDIFNFIRAISLPGPQARTFLRDEEIKINKAEWLENAPKYRGKPGAILTVEQKAFYVKTKDSFLKIVEWSGERVRVGDLLK